MKTKELPPLPQLPDHAAWIGGVLVDMGNQDETEARQIIRDEQQSKIAEWQAQTGFAGYVATVASNHKTEARAERRVATTETVRRVAGAAIAPVEKVAAPIGRYLGAVASNLKENAVAATFDVFEGTHSLADLRHDRKVKRVVKHYARLHLIDDEPCAKHRRALQHAEGKL